MENMTPMLDAFSSGGGLLAAIVTYLITSVSLFAIARQDGEEFAWFAFVPILDLFLMCKIGDVNPLVLLLFFVPCVNIFVFAYLWARVGDTRDKAIGVGSQFFRAFM